jgi:cytochrome c
MAKCALVSYRKLRQKPERRRTWQSDQRQLQTTETVGSYWLYAPTLFDYIRRAMPQNAPQSLSNDDVYAVSAYILNMNGLLPADTTLDATTLSAIKMPNRNMFTGDPRPDVKNPACERNC